MLNTIKTINAIGTHSLTNRLIYYGQKLPIIGKRIPESLYGNADAKRAFTFLASLLKVIWGLASKLLYMFIFLYLPITSLLADFAVQDQLIYFLYLFVLLSFVTTGISSATILEPKRSKYVAVKLMHISPDTYMRAMLTHKYVTYFLYYIPTLLLFVLLLGGNVVQALILAAAVTLWRVGCEYLHLLLFERKGIVLIKKTVIVWSVMFACYIAAYLPLLMKMQLIISLPVLFWTVTGVSLLLGGYGALRLNKLPSYRAAVDAATKRDDPLLNLGQYIADAQKQSVSTKESDLTHATTQTQQFENKQGYSYLNAIFFARHGNVIRNLVKKILVVIGLVGIAAILFSLSNLPKSSLLADNIGRIPPYFLFIFSVIPLGETISRSLFYNCDVSLLRYSFYRQAAPEHFAIRLRKVASLNIMISVVLGVLLTTAALVGGNPATIDLVYMWLCLLAISFFFSLHFLFMYYIFQPYSSELNAKNPFYYIITYIVSCLCALMLILRMDTGLFTAIVLGVTVIYFFTALLLVRKYAHRTLRIK